MSILGRGMIARNLLSLVTGALVVLFIALPFATVLRESVIVERPLGLAQLQAMTGEALAHLPADERDAALDKWSAAMTLPERVAALNAAFDLSDLPTPWDRSGAFAHQAASADAALAHLDPSVRQRVQEDMRLAHVTLHKRTALAFLIRDRIDPDQFDSLRSGIARQIGLGNYAEVATTAHFRRAALNSLALAASSTLLTVTLALSLAYGLNSGGLPRPGLTRAVLLLPLVAPPVLMATTTLMLFGRRGLVTSELLDRTLGLIDADQVNIYGPAGILIAQALAFLPAALIVLDNGFRGADARLSEAASGLGASYAAVLGRVVLPLGYPALKRAIVLVFIFSLTDFSNPMLLGGGFPVLAEVIYDQIISYRNMPLAAAICVILLVPPLLLYLGLELAGGRRGFVAAGVASNVRPPVPAPVRRVLGALAVGVGLAVLTVYATLVLGAFTRIWGVDWGLTTAHFRPGSSAADSGLREVGDSLRLALVAAPLGGVLAVLVAYVVERLRPPGANLIFLITLLPAILPGIVFGIGYILAFNAPLGFPSLSLSGGFAILVLNVVFGNLFVGVLAGRAALQRLDRSVDEAAEGLGAGLGARLWLVVLPLLRVPLMLGALYVFIDSLTTLSSVIFLVSGDHKLAAISIFNDANSSDFGPAAAKSVALLALALAAMAALSAIERRSAIRPRQDRITS